MVRIYEINYDISIKGKIIYNKGDLYEGQLKDILKKWIWSNEK